MSKRIYWQFLEAEACGFVFDEDKAEDMADRGIDTYIPKELYDKRVRQGWDKYEPNMLEGLKAFLADKTAWDMYVTGRAGTGKTTDLNSSVKYCIDMEIPYVVLAFTHKACGILREKLPDAANISTIDSFLRKRPGVNTDATKLKHVDITVRTGDVEKVKLVFVDEYSMVGERDLMAFRELQDEDYDGNPEVKVVWLGDPYQLPPVGDAESVVPYGDYALTLTKVYRRADDSRLSAPIDELVHFIQGEDVHELTVSDQFVRGEDIVEGYLNCKEDKILLAYTNKRVQTLNAECQGRAEPAAQDRLFSPTTRHHYELREFLDPALITEVDKPYGEPLPLNTKYRTLEYLLKMEDIEFAHCVNDDGEDMCLAFVFGHYTYKKRLEELKIAATKANQAIEKKHKAKAAFWAKANPQDKLARERAKAWRDFLTFDECVICLDFPHAMTVHKSQGSTFNTVFLDTDDLGTAAGIDYNMYLRLMYVALSRASNKVITS